MALSTNETDHYSDGSTTASSWNTAEIDNGRYDITQFEADRIELPASRCRDDLLPSYYSLNIPFFRLTKRIRHTTISSVAHFWVVVVLLNCLVPSVSAVFIPYQNCLSEDYQNSAQLQFLPLFVDAKFNSTDPSHNLNVTVWGNVTGSLPTVILPPGSNTSYWDNVNNTDGKIVDVDDPTAQNPLATSFFRKVNVLTYQPYQADPADFCDSLINGTCPLGPVFPTNASL